MEKNNGLKIMMMLAMTVIASKSKTQDVALHCIKKESRNELYIFQINIYSSDRRRNYIKKGIETMMGMFDF